MNEEKPNPAPEKKNNEGGDSVTSSKSTRGTAPRFSSLSSRISQRLSHHFKNLKNLSGSRSIFKQPLNYEELKKKLSGKLNKKEIIAALRDFDPQAVVDWTTGALQKRGASIYGPLITIVLSTYFLADLAALMLGDLIPEPRPVRSAQFLSGGNRPKPLSDYSIISVRNLFNSKGLIPGETELGPGSGGGADLGGPPVKTTLPLNLIGTVIMSDERFSLATIEDSSSKTVYPVRIEDEIPGKLKIVSIEPRRVIFVNQSSGRREFIELPEENPGVAKVAVGKSTAPQGGIDKLSPTQFNISRSAVDRALADFNNVLTQARAVPNENGPGFKLFQIVPNSIYDQLGLQNGDVIKGVNGEPLSANDLNKAFEMLNDLKGGANHLELQIQRDGKPMNFTFDVR